MKPDRGFPADSELVRQVRALLARADASLRSQTELVDSRSKDELIGMLAHELRNPLSPVATTLQIIAMTGRAEPEQIAMMQRQVQEMIRLVDGLLDLSRIVLGKLDVQPAPTDLAEVVARAVETVTPLFDHHSDLELRVRRGVFVRGDLARLTQVVANLLHNAIKFSPRDAPIVVSVERVHDRGRVEVSDHGQGMSEEMLEHMFEAFAQQPQSFERPRGGLGIGLSVARGIVELHGGTIRGASPGIGKGSVFSVEIPLVERPAATAEERIPTPSPEATRVLVVDDNVEAAAALRLGLTLLGYRVEVAHDGPGALDVAEQFQPDVALLDIRLHGMDGYELARRMRARGDVRLIAVSGYARPEDFERSRAAGFSDHIVKPFDLRVIARSLGKSYPAPSQS